MGSSSQQLCIVRMDFAKPVLGSCRKMQRICSPQKNRCRQSAVHEFDAFKNVFRQRQPSERSDTRLVKKLLKCNFVQTRADGALSKLPVER